MRVAGGDIDCTLSRIDAERSRKRRRDGGIRHPEAILANVVAAAVGERCARATLGELAPPLGVSLSHWCRGSILREGDEECVAMTKQLNEPGPGRSTSDAAFNEVTKEIAQRNERTQNEARMLRVAREQKLAQWRRQEECH
jgi:hypothetical protein